MREVSDLNIFIGNGEYLVERCYHTIHYRNYFGLLYRDSFEWYMFSYFCSNNRNGEFTPCCTNHHCKRPNHILCRWFGDFDIVISNGKYLVNRCNYILYYRIHRWFLHRNGYNERLLFGVFRNDGNREPDSHG